MHDLRDRVVDELRAGGRELRSGGGRSDGHGQRGTGESAGDECGEAKDQAHAGKLRLAEADANGPESPALGDRDRVAGASGASALYLSLAFVAASVGALIIIEGALLVALPSAPAYLGILLAFPAAAAVYLASGVVAWARRPSNRVGALMVLGALAWVGAGLANVTIPALTGIGLVVATVPAAV